jgi:hypothetical protein
VSVDSLGVPMSPKPHVSRHRTEHIRGLISTERTHSHENHPHTFCVQAHASKYSNNFSHEINGKNE